MKLIRFLPILLLAGCANFNTTVTEVHPDGTQKTTTVRASTFFDSTSDLSKVTAGQTEKGTQKVGVGSLNQESSATNLVKLLQAAAILAQ